ncbi:MAG TPA: hypothetical protein VGB14_15950 [Acidimicrobiales bacterium]|jgi:uncharacterized protein YegP (UPF0339 family)
MVHTHVWDEGDGGDAFIKSKQSDEDGRWRFVAFDTNGLVVGRGRADGYSTKDEADEAGQRLVGGFWHPVTV